MRTAFTIRDLPFPPRMIFPGLVWLPIGMTFSLSQSLIRQALGRTYDMNHDTGSNFKGTYVVFDKPHRCEGSLLGETRISQNFHIVLRHQSNLTHEGLEYRVGGWGACQPLSAQIDG